MYTITDSGNFFRTQLEETTACLPNAHVLSKTIQKVFNQSYKSEAEIVIALKDLQAKISQDLRANGQDEQAERVESTIAQLADKLFPGTRLGSKRPRRDEKPVHYQKRRRVGKTPGEEAKAPLEISEAKLSGSKKPSAAEAAKVYWKLGDDFWRQIIDGTFQQYGPKVFDEGLHGSVKEPGFFSSLKAGCELVSRHLTEPPTPDLYKELHRTLCSHFSGEKTRTLIDASKIGIFRNWGGISSGASILFDIPGVDKEKILTAVFLEKIPFFSKKKEPTAKETKHTIFLLFSQLKNDYSTERAWLSKIENDWKNSTNFYKIAKKNGLVA